MLSDHSEMSFDSSPHDRHCDGDRLLDGQEVRKSTDPVDVDSDDDGLSHA